MAVPQSQKQEREQLSRLLRAQGRSWVEIAAVFRQRYRINPRLAFRLVHGWSQGQVVDQWNSRWPDQLKTFKNISYWELWPGGTGHAPSFDSLGKLAQLYQCSVADLLADLPDHRSDDAHQPASGASGPSGASDTAVPLRRVEAGSGPVALASESLDRTVPVTPKGGALGLPVPMLSPQGLASIVSTTTGALLADPTALVDCVATGLSWRLGQTTYDQLTSWLRIWAETMDRREFLRALGWAATAAAGAPTFDGLDADDQARLGGAVVGAHQVDEQVIATIEPVLSAARRQDDVLGPQAALDTILAQRSLAQLLLKNCPQRLLPRLLSLYSTLSCSAGWLYFDLNDFGSAVHHYQAARDAAHEAGDTDLGGYALCRMSLMAEWRGQRPVAIDLTAAAQRLVGNSSDPRLRAYVEGRWALVYATDGRADDSLRASDRAARHLAEAYQDESPGSLVYFYDDEMLTYQKSKCHLRLDESQKTLAITRQALASVDASRPRDLAVAKLCLAKAYLAAGEVDEGATITTEVTDLARQNRSPRLAGELRATRAKMEPWSQRPTVKHLDDRLAAYGLA
jgi:tetratricopeptide (TPR) repeat protein